MTRLLERLFPVQTSTMRSDHTLPADEVFQFWHGSFDIRVLSDGHMVVPATFLAQTAPPEELHQALVGTDASLTMVYPKANIPLIRHGEDLILVDVGDGGKFQPTLGVLLGALRANRIDPKLITKVILTHAHPDHLWGLLGSANKLICPNAEYYVGTKEWNFWMSPGVNLQLPQDFRGVVSETQMNLRAIEHRLTFLNPGDEVVGGMSILSTPGHTPGHLSLELAGGNGLIITADAVTHGKISFEHPAWQNGFDFDSETAVKTRHSLLDRLSHEKIKLLSYHLPYPGIGYAQEANGAYRFIPEKLG